MTSPDRADPTETWGLVFHDTGIYRPAHTRQEWAQIADAIGTADLLHHNRARVSGEANLVRGDTAWCQIAVDTYRRLSAAGAYSLLRPGDEPHCFADEHLIRAWLHAPWVPPGEDRNTMLEASGWDVAFERDRRPDPAAITMLVGAAQDAGVFGIERHRVNLWRFFGDGTLPEHTFTVTVRPPGGPGVSSDLVRFDQLLPGGREPIGTIAGVLAAVAGVANGVLANARTTTHDAAHRVRHHIDDPPPLPPYVEGRSIGTRGRPFQPLTGTHPAAGADSPAPSPVRPPRHGRT